MFISVLTPTPRRRPAEWRRELQEAGIAAAVVAVTAAYRRRRCCSHRRHHPPWSPRRQPG